MIEELARHAGHGEILREQILAAYGSQTERLLSNAPIHVPTLGGSALAATPQADRPPYAEAWCRCVRSSFHYWDGGWAIRVARRISGRYGERRSFTID